MQNLFKNKKAASVDNFFAAIMFFGMAIFFLVLTVMWNEMTTSAMDTNFWSRSSIGAQVKENGQTAVDNFDFILVVGVYFSMHIGILLLAFMLRTHPFVYVVSLLLSVLLVMVAVPLSNAFETVSANTAFTSVITAYPITSHIMQNLPYYETIWSFLTIIVTFALARWEGFI